MTRDQRRLFTTFLIILGFLLPSCAPAAAPPVVPSPAPAKADQPPVPLAGKSPSPTVVPKPTSAEQSRYGGVLTISTAGDPISLDMHQEQTYLTQNVIQGAYNGIIQFDPKNPEDVIGDLAKSWEVSKDGLTYNFTLHEKVNFHDGTLLTTEDVKVSFDRQIDPPKGVLSGRRSDLGAIQAVDVAGKDGVRFVLKYPSPSFLTVISSGFMSIYSKAFVEKKGHMKNDVMGTGPYKLKTYAVGTSLEYVKNPDYFVKGRPYLDGITFYIVKDGATRVAAFRTGRVKLTGPGQAGLTPAEAEVVKKNMPQAVLEPYSAIRHGNFVFNTLEKPWDDLRVRQAVHLTINRQVAIDMLAQGYGELGSNMPGKWGIPKEELSKMPGWRQPKDADVAEAKRLLAEAGFPQGFSMKMLTRTDKDFQELSVFFADQVAKIGIRVELDIKEPAVRTQLLNEGAFSAHSMYSALSYADPANVSRYWARPLRGQWLMNWHRSSDEKIWGLFDKQSRALDPAERLKIVRELDLRMIELASRPVTHWVQHVMGMWPEVKDRGKLIGNYSFQKYQDVWLAK